jgi:hypothetical protein
VKVETAVKAGTESEGTNGGGGTNGLKGADESEGIQRIHTEKKEMYGSRVANKNAGPVGQSVLHGHDPEGWD